VEVERLEVVLAGQIGPLKRALEQADRATAGARRQLQQLEHVANRATAGTGAGARRAASGLKTMEGAARGVNRQLAIVDKAAGKVSSSLGTIASRARLVGAAVGTTLVGAIVGSGFAFNSLQQRAQVSFTTILKSGARARAMLATLTTFAEQTPFQLTSLIQYTQRLLAVGFTAKEVVPTLTAVGDSVAALGGSAETLDRVTLALGQIKSKGALQAEEMLQLAEAGIPAWQILAEKIGVSIPEAIKLVEKRAVSSDVAIAALIAGMNERFAGMMAKQSKGWSGLVSNAMDAWSRISGVVTKPLFDEASKQLAGFLKLTKSPAFLEGVQRFAAWLGEKIPAAIASTVGFFRTHWQSIQDGLVGTAKLAADAGRFLIGVAGKANDVTKAVGGWREVLIAAGIAYVGLRATALGTMVAIQVSAIATAKTIRIALISSGIGAVVVAAGIGAELLIRHWDKVKEFFSRFGRALPGMLDAGWEAIKAGANLAAYGILKAFTAAIRFVLKLASYLPKIGDEAKKALDRMNTYIDSFRERGMRQLGQAGAEMGDAWGRQFYDRSAAWLQAFSAHVTKATESIETQRTRGGGGAGKGGAVQPEIGAPDTHRGTLLSAFTGHGTPRSATGAKDYPAPVGTLVLAPEDGELTRTSGSPGSGTPGGPGGLSLYFVGKSHTAYYITHLEWVNKRGRYKAGDVIGRIGPHVSGPHAHVEQSKDPAALKWAGGSSGGTTPPPPPKMPPLPKMPPIPKLPPAAGEKKKEKVPPPLPPRLELQIEKAKRTRGAGDDLRAYARAIAFLREKLEHASKAAERLKITKAINQINAAVKSIRANEAKRKAEQIQAAFEKFMEPQIDRALRAFDRATTRGLKQLGADLDRELAAIDDQLNATLADIERRRVELTPAEAALENLRRGRENARFQRDLEEAQRDLEEAQKGGDPEEIRRAQERIDDLMLDQQERALEEQARLERAARDAQAEDERAHAEKMADARRAALQEEFDERRQAYEDEREDARSHYEQMLREYAKYLLERNRLAKLSDEDLRRWLEEHPEFGVAPGDVPGRWNGGREGGAGGMPPRRWWEEFYGAAGGADFIARGPVPLMVGEGGRPEHVQVTPLGAGAEGPSLATVAAAAGGIHLTVNVNNLWANEAEAKRVAEMIEKHLFRNISGIDDRQARFLARRLKPPLFRGPGELNRL
jgi:tape measure domain-containing protein